MKSKIQLDTLELIVISKRNKLDLFEGDASIKELVRNYFEKSISVVTSGKNDKKLGLNSSVAKTIKPGEKDYIMAVLIEIRNELNLRTEYNIKELKSE